jgi:hypothetical protein
VSDPIEHLLTRLDRDLQSLFRLVERVCREAHVDDDNLANDEFFDLRDHAETASDTADEVLVKAQAIIAEARLAIRQHRGGAA